MPRRVRLPGADELFRPTADQSHPGPVEPSPAESGFEQAQPAAGGAGSQPASRVTGRVRHDQKITVYVSTDELIALETARVTLRAHGVNADRGRIVREAIALALADLDSAGPDSALLARLRGRSKTIRTTGEQR